MTIKLAVILSTLVSATTHAAIDCPPAGQPGHKVCCYFNRADEDCRKRFVELKNISADELTLALKDSQLTKVQQTIIKKELSLR